jgi:hypothetical protein
VTDQATGVLSAEPTAPSRSPFEPVGLPRGTDADHLRHQLSPHPVTSSRQDATKSSGNRPEAYSTDKIRERKTTSATDACCR